MRLENWSVVGPTEVDPYTPPEAVKRYLAGEVYGSENFAEGYKIQTSSIMEVKGGKVTTRSGSVYELGEPEGAFVDFCRLAGCHVPTKEEPIKVRKES